MCIKMGGAIKLPINQCVQRLILGIMIFRPFLLILSADSKIGTEEIVEAWKKVTLENPLDTVVFPHGLPDGFGHRMKRLFSAVAFLHSIGIRNIEFTGYPENFSQDVTYLDAENSSRKVYCHSFGEYRKSKILFKRLKKNIGGESSQLKMQKMVRKMTQTSEGVAWIKQLRCEYLNFDQFHDLKHSNASWDESCRINPRILPHNQGGNCSRYFYSVGDVELTDKFKNENSVQKAKEHFQIVSPNRDNLTCNFSKNSINAAIHFRLGDSIQINAERYPKDVAFQKTIDEFVLFFSRSNLHTPPIQLNVYAEIPTDCPNPVGQGFPVLPSMRVHQNLHETCGCHAPSECPEAHIFGKNCNKKCRSYTYSASHQMKLHNRNNNTRIKEVFNAEINFKSKKILIPLTLHVGSHSILDDFRCLASSDILVGSCSFFSGFASVLSQGIFISQKCNHGRQTGDLLLKREDIVKTKQWESIMGTYE